MRAKVAHWDNGAIAEWQARPGQRDLQESVKRLLQTVFERPVVAQKKLTYNNLIS